MKKIIITIIILIVILTNAIAEDTFDRGEFYPLLTIVVEKNYWSDGVYVITCQDITGNLWCFFDEEDIWTIGDLANLLMWNMGGTLEEDEIIEIYRTGHIENINAFYQIVEWE